MSGSTTFNPCSGIVMNNWLIWCCCAQSSNAAPRRCQSAVRHIHVARLLACMPSGRVMAAWDTPSALSDPGLACSQAARTGKVKNSRTKNGYLNMGRIGRHLSLVWHGVGVLPDQ
ncbi:hypothetical protein [Massilia horti]|uniref:Uncharacterized protein n=1 Tax=Massilia horti TaxID=2562153 RepID=A0A4Y9SWU7_9BURK|nr:hypothetical protein [Massilia horti]TFW30902.1 hypothetical protein E4O92_15295 [Massilia horti]